MDLSIEHQPSDAADSKSSVPATTGKPAETAGSKTRGKADGDLSAVLARFIDPPGAADGGSDAKAKRHDKLLSYAAHAALIVALVGFAWVVGGHVIQERATPTKAVEHAAADASQNNERAELQHTIQVMSGDIKSLRANLEALRTSASRTPTADEVRGLEKTLESLKSRLDAAKGETTASLSQLAGKIDHAQQEPNAKLREVADRLDRIEKQTAAPATTGSIPSPAAVTINPVVIPLPPVKPTQSAAEVAEAKRPQLITSWVVRDVYDGIALVEGARGAIEVVPGETIPGAGVVKSIERRGAGWVVVTSRGVVDFARD